MVTVQDFDGGAVKDGDHGASQLGCKHRTGNQEREEDGPEAAHGSHASRLARYGEGTTIGSSVGRGFGRG